MLLHRSARLATIVVGLATIAAPSRAHAQLAVDASAGLASADRITNIDGRSGMVLALGVSQTLPGTSLALGVEASRVRFGQGALEPKYQVGYMLGCNTPGPCSLPTNPTGHLELANFLLTGKCTLHGGRVRPYLGAAAGVTRSWAPQEETIFLVTHPRQTNGAARLSMGAETHFGSLRAALDVSYAGVVALRYNNEHVRYTPITLRFGF